MSYNKKLDYLPITKNISDKISLYINKKIEKNFENYNYKGNIIDIIFSDLFNN